MSSGVYVRVGSHRARRKLKALVGPTQGYFSWTREGEWALIPSEYVDEAVTITGIARVRNTSDLVACIDFNGTVDTGPRLVPLG